ncbi:hypothetical protein [Acinetobacter nectaris]|uniref:hypothetical protein n=1 Tax=Acinetobacter nectaris TaxID=1219382 RepID=UPI001F2C18D1|nr:hypothetical protein [Acinetobacter nectaris]MCF8999909.1 hypothetical protein [Acinetobacter nectaris]MCF9027392.1 hypothetical protein [Acinetobacter nectaris]
MKKILLFVAPMALLLSACVTGGGTSVGTNTTTAEGMTQQLGMTALKIAIDAKCVSEMNKMPAWQVASKVMSSSQQQSVQSSTCGCVSDQAPQSVTVMDLANAALDPNARVTLAHQVIQKTVSSCMAQALKS